MTDRDLAYRKFETLMSKFSYRFKGYDKIDFNYSINEIKAPHNQVANHLLSTQYT